MFVYTMQPIAQPVGQPAVSCRRGIRSPCYRRLVARLSGSVNSLTVRGVLAAAQVGDRNAGSVTLQQEIVGVAGEIRRRVST